MCGLDDLDVFNVLYFLDDLDDLDVLDVLDVLCGNLYFVREVHVEGGKHLNHYITMWLYGYVQTNFNIYMEILRLCSSLHCLFFTLIRKWGVVGDWESGSR